MLNNNFGEIRFFSIFGFFLGLSFYFLTFTKIIIKFSYLIINIITYIVKLFLEIIMTPFILIYKLFRRPVTKASYMINKKRKNLLHLIKVYAKIKIRKIRQAINFKVNKK